MVSALELFDYFSDLSEINRPRYTVNLRVNCVVCGDSHRGNAAEWTIKPDSLDEILLASFSGDVTRAAQAWTIAAMLDVDFENRKQNRTK